MYQSPSSHHTLIYQPSITILSTHTHIHKHVYTHIFSETFEAENSKLDYRLSSWSLIAPWWENRRWEQTLRSFIFFFGHSNILQRRVNNSVLFQRITKKFSRCRHANFKTKEKMEFGDWRLFLCYFHKALSFVKGRQHMVWPKSGHVDI